MLGENHSLTHEFPEHLDTIAYFGAFRTAISVLPEHLFRFNPNAHSAIIRTLLSELRNQRSE